MANTLKIFVFDEVHINEPIKIKAPVFTFVEQVFSVFQYILVIPTFLARPPTKQLGALKSVASLLFASAFKASSLKIEGSVNGN